MGTMPQNAESLPRLKAGAVAAQPGATG